jgi:hypothetical protein
MKVCSWCGSSAPRPAMQSAKIRAARDESAASVWLCGIGYPRLLAAFDGDTRHEFMVTALRRGARS